MKKFVFEASFFCVVFAGWFVLTEIYTEEARLVNQIEFTISNGESVTQMSERLRDEQVIRSAILFRALIRWRDMDTTVKAGTYTVRAPITLARVIDALESPDGPTERTITILPGWDLRDIADYFGKEGIVSPDDFYSAAGRPLHLPNKEGYLAPETYRIFVDATAGDIVEKLSDERMSELTPEIRDEINASGRTLDDVMIVASIVEREVRSEEDRAKVADIFWRRLDHGWPLQADSTVHYVVGKKGDVFTTSDDRGTDSPWNTYKYPGLPPGPISNPSVESILATVHPEKNPYWFFLTTVDGEVKYAKTVEEHTTNVQKYLR